MRQKVFVSYDHSEDVAYKRLLQAWDANSRFDFEFDSRGPNIPIASEEAAVIKAALTRMMRSATHLLVIVGEKSHSSAWMRWEIDRARQADIGLHLAAVKLSRDYQTPAGLLGVGTSWAMSFTLDNIINALADAA